MKAKLARRGVVVDIEIERTGRIEHWNVEDWRLGTCTQAIVGRLCMFRRGCRGAESSIRAVSRTRGGCQRA